MPDAGYFGLTYELLFVGESEWTDITPLVDSRQTKISDAGCSEDLKSVISKCTLEMRYGTATMLTEHSTIVAKLLAAKEAGTVVRFKMSGLDDFVGKVDLGNFDQKNGRIPGFVTIDCEDNSYLLDENMPSSFEYPISDDLDDAGYAVFDKTDLAQSSVMLRFLDAGYTIDDIDIDGSDSIPEKVRRIVYDADDERTYRDFIDTLLFEHCAVLYPTPQGKLSVRRLYKEAPVSERSIDKFLIGDKIATGGGDYQYDGVKIAWSGLGKLLGAVVYNANITTEVDDEGAFVGEEIQPEHYWPENGDIEETWQEFNATFLDREYQTKVSRLKNKDLSLISVKNAYYEVDKDPDVILANNPPNIEPTKARVLFYNSHATDIKKIYGFTIVGDALFRNKLNEATYPVDAKKLDDPYETEFVYDSTVAQTLANHLHRFRKYGDLQHRWAEIGVDTPMFQIVTVAAPDTLISSLAMVISQSRTYPAPNTIKRSNSAIGVTAFNSEPVKMRSIQIGGAPVNTGPAGSSGTRSVVQFILGTADAPYSDAGNVVGTSLGRVGTSLALVGVEGATWLYDAPIPDAGEFVWRREGYYTPPELWPKVWNITRMTGASSFGLTLHASASTIPVSSRGVPYGSDITLNAIFQNIPTTYTITWGITGASFVDAGTNQTKVVDVSTITADAVIVTVSVLFGGVTYTNMVTLTKVADGKPAPVNLGSVTTVPTDVGGEPLVVGDYFLWAGTTTEDYTKGEIYEYTGSAWALSTNGNLVMTMFDDFANLANDVGSTVLGNAVIKKLVALEAVVKNLVAQNMKAGPGTGLASSGFRFRAQTDSVGDGSDVAVFDVYKDDKQLFKVDIATGLIYFGEHFWYNPADGKIHTLDDNIVIDSAGFLTGVGSVFEDSTIYGELIHPALSTQTAESGATPVDFPTPSRWKGSALYDAMTSIGSELTAVGGGSTHTQMARWASSGVLFKSLYDTPSTRFRGNNTSWFTLYSFRSPSGSSSSARFTMDISSYFAGFPSSSYKFQIGLLKNGSLVFSADISSFDPGSDSITGSYYGGYAINDLWEIKAIGIGTSYSDYVDISLVQLQQYSNAKGMVGKYSGGTFKFYDYNGFYAEAVAETSPNTFDYSTEIDYVSGAAIYALMSTYPNGVVKATDPAQSDITYGAKTDEPIYGVMKIGAEARVYYSDNSYDSFIGNTTEGATTGWYIVSASYLLLTKIAALLTLSVIPKNTTSDIGGDGSGTNPPPYRSVNSAAFNTISSREKKREIRPLEKSALSLIKQLQIVSYKYRDMDDEKEHTGLIAENSPQEITAENGKSINLGDSVGMLFKAMQEMIDRLERIESKKR